MISKFPRLAPILGACFAAALFSGCATDASMRGQSTMGGAVMDSSSSRSSAMGAGTASGAMRGAPNAGETGGSTGGASGMSGTTR